MLNLSVKINLIVLIVVISSTKLYFNFIFASLPNKDAGELAAELRACGIIVRYFNKPRINQFLRITIGTDEQNQRLVETLKQDILA